MIDILKSTTAYFGRQRENIAREVIFDITSLKREFPDAVYSLVLKRTGEGETYTAVATTIEGNEFRYQPTAWATEKAGIGNWEIHAIDANTGLVAKSITGSFMVDEALDDAVNASPEVADNWIAQVMEARDEAVEAARMAQEVVSIDVEEIQSSIANKLDRPSESGTNGQLLMSDGIGGQRWADPPETYVLPVATTRRLGGIMVGDGLEMDGDGRLNAPSASPATEQHDGLLRAVDQRKLNTIEEGANNYILPKATTDSLGGLIVGSNLSVDENGRVSADAERLRPATGERMGGVKVGTNLRADQDGTLHATVPIASAQNVGGVKVGRNLQIDPDGTLNSQDSYVLPAATAARLGGIKVGDNLSIDEQGRLSADAQPIQPATEEELGGIKIGNNLSIDQTGVASAYSYDINKTLKEDGQTYQLNLIRSDGNEEEIVQSVDLPAGGGGGGGSSVEGFYLDIERVTASPIIATTNDQVSITVDIQSREGSDPSAPFIDGTYTWKIGTNILMTGAYSRIRNTFDLTPFLNNGTQRVSLTVVQSDSGIQQTRTWNIQLVDVRLESSFMDQYTNPVNEEVGFTYVPYGAVPKTVHFKLDGTELPSVPLASNVSGSTQMYVIPAHSHGTHSLEVWMIATVGANSVESNHIYKDIIWYDEDGSIPIISCAQKVVRVPINAEFNSTMTYYTKENGLYSVSDIDYSVMDPTSWESALENGLYYMDNKAKQYSSTTIRFNVYDPTSETPEVILYEDGAAVATRILTEATNNVWVYKTDNSGVHTLTIECGVTSVDIIMDIEALDVDITPVMSNLVFDFNPAGRSNSDSDRLWSYTNNDNNTYAMRVSEDFDWVNGGYQQDEEGDMSFLIKAGTRAIINRRMFEQASDMTKRNGHHFKVIFRVDNVRDASATWLSCMGQNGAAEVGIEMNVHEAYVYSGNNAVNSENPTSLYSPYSEGDRVEFEYDIHPLDINDNTATSYFVSYEDGTMFRPIIYDRSNILQQLPASEITIGSDDCDVRIYRIKEYKASLNDGEVMSNFIADAPSGEEMYARYTRNQIYDQDGYLTAEHLAEVCPDLRIIKISAPHFTNKKSNTVGDTTVTCIYRNGDPVLDNWTVTSAAHSGQGTTSDNYGISGRNIDLKLKKDDKVGANPVVTFGDGSQSAPGKVKISLTRDSIETNYFNIKVNIASSENANNALLAKRYDRYLPYETPAHKRDPRIKTTMEFFNCAVFIQETGPMSEHEEFADTNWHFYGIGNIGDSKKTDKTRAYTEGDPKEFVNEILDNTKPNARFDTGVYNMLVAQRPVNPNRFIDYYTPNQDGTFVLQRYLNNTWVIVNSNITEITNGAVATFSTRPSVGITGIEYYITSGSGYDMYIWRNGEWSTAAAQTAADLEDAKKRHMATAIDPLQWVSGNEKYNQMMADAFDGDDTWEMRFEAAEDVYEDDAAAYDAQHAANIDVWRQMYTWMITSSDDDFVAQIGDWFIKDAALYAYLFTEQYTMMDNRAKNTFWHWAKFYVSQQEYNTSDICYDKVDENANFDSTLTYYSKDNDAYVQWSGEWNNRPQLYVHNNYYTVNDTAASINNGYRFDFWDYDNDSAIGIDNTGAMGLSYGKEDIDQVVEGDPTSKNVYNAADSVFWRRIRLLLYNDLRSMYQQLENSGCWTAAGFIQEFDDWQAQWPEELWSRDMERKYIRPYYGTSYDNSTIYWSDGTTPKKSSQYLIDMLNGRKKYQRRQWIRDQSVYMGTKYLASSITNNSILLRCYEPSGAVVTPNYTLRIVPYTNMYLSVLFGSGNKATQVRAKAGVEYELECPISMSGATDIPFYIYAASNIQELSDLSACYFTTNNFASAVKLKKLKVGSDVPGYSNQIQVLNLGTGRHDLLEELDVTNCRNLVGTSNSGTMNLSGCGRLREFYAGGTSISSVIFATNGRLERAVMPDSLTGLTMIGLDKLISFTANYDNLTTLNIEGGTIDSRAIIGDAYDTIRSLRIVDINWTVQDSFADSSILNALSDMTNMYDSYLSGIVNIAGPVTQRELDHYEDIWPYLTVTYESVMPEYRVDYVNGDGQTLLGYEYVNAGGTLTNPIGRQIIGPGGGHITLDTPTMEQTDQYTFIFDSWDTLEGYVTRPRTVLAVYNAITRRYQVNWYGKIGGLKLASGEYEYGSEAVYDYTPTKDTVRNVNKTYYYKVTDSFVEYPSDSPWNSRPTLYEHNDIPVDVTSESREVYKLFAGWDKSTGYVRPDTTNPDGHVDIYAVWEECDGIPDIDVSLSTMNASQVYAVTRQVYDVVKQHFTMDPPDHIPITLGFDPEFSNVRSDTIVDSKRYFDGTSAEIVLDGEGHQINLFSEDAPSFTMAIDFEMRNAGSGDNGKTLIGCYDTNGQLGFRLRCGRRESDDAYRPIIEWGNQSFEVSYSYEYNPGDNYYDTRYRDIVVIRHVAGDPTLYVYTSNVSQYFNLNGITRYSKTRTTYADTNTPLVLGGTYVDVDEEFDNRYYGTGYIYWCKIWYDDLGEFNSRRIAAWPREVVDMEYYGTQRYTLADGGRSNASFISHAPLYGRAVYSPANFNIDALWSNSPARTLLASRVLGALPVQWQSMIRTVRLESILRSDAGSMDTERTYDKLYLPAYAEVYPITSDPFIQEQFSNRSNEGTMITWFSDFAHRAKSKILNIRSNARIWTGDIDPTTQVGNNVHIGDVWTRSLTGGYDVYVFVDNDSIERDHLAVRGATIQTEIGGWVRSQTIWGLRTPYSGLLNNDHQYQYHVVTALGVVATAAYSTSNAYGDGIAIDFCFSV